MTKLSIFLWAADAIGGIEAFFTIVAIIGFIVLALAFFGTLDSHEEKLSENKWTFIISLVLCMGCILISCIIPSKKTLYMIAGVELADSIMQTEDYQKAKKYLGESGIQMMDDIKSIIHAEAQDLLEKKKKE